MDTEKKRTIRIGKRFDIASQCLVILSIVTFMIETSIELPPHIMHIFDISEVVIIFLFCVEYIIRFYAAPNRLGFVFSMYGLIDLLAILPFVLFLELDLRSVRALRLFRLFRIFRLARYTRVVEIFQEAIYNIKDELLIFCFATFLLLYVSSVGIFHCESEIQPESFGTMFQCFWWSVITLTTVGYGDAYPITALGKVFTSFIALMGIGIVAVPVGLITSSFIDLANHRKENNDSRRRSLGDQRELDNK